MSKRYLYLTIAPEALIASMLEPEQFGSYLASGSKRFINGPAVFLELDPATAASAFGIGNLEERCQPHANGELRRSSYIAIYRVLEQLPIGSVRALYLTTRKGISLRLEPTPGAPQGSDVNYLYQELGPVGPRVVTTLGPKAFVDFITRNDNPLRVPTIFFAHLNLGALAQNVDSKDTDAIPYGNIEHLRQCLQSLHESKKLTKVVNRDTNLNDLFTNLASGLYLGKGTDLLSFPMPEADTLARDHHPWLSSARSWDRIH